MRKKSFIKLLLVAIVIAMPFLAYAKTINFNLKTKFRPAIAIQNVIPIDYGTIAYNGNSAGTDITIDPTDSSISCTNTTDYGCPASGIRGSFNITGSLGLPIEISCDDTAKMALSNQNLDVVNTEVAMAGVANLCSGLNNISTTHILSALTQDNTVYVGATIEVPNTGLALLGAYSTTNPSGNAIKVRVRYQ